MSKLASKIIQKAISWLGKNEDDGSHREIVDIYNTHRPLPRGYTVTYTDAWCAAFISALVIALGYTDIIPVECSCTRMIALLKNIGAFVENDAYVPKVGDLIFYDWDDSGRGDNTGSPDHVGIVESVKNGVITIIEGNYRNAVARREIAVNGRYIRGYGVPKYDAEVTEETDLVLAFQQAALADDVALPKYGADGVWGPETASAATAIVQYGNTGERVRLIQSLLLGLGYDLGRGGADGIFGDKTEAAVKAFQAKHSLAVDGLVGINTWMVLLGVT